MTGTGSVATPLARTLRRGLGCLALLAALLTAGCTGDEGLSELLVSTVGFGEIPDIPAPVAPDFLRTGDVEPGSLYRLGTGDELEIEVFGHEDLSGVFAIDGDGNVSFPLLGPVPAAGLTQQELVSELAARLDADFVVNPKVNVAVRSFRPFFVLGQVNMPGGYPFVAGLNVREAVAIAGGFTRRAHLGKVVIVRRSEGGEDKFLAPLDALILPGDTVEVRRRLF